MTQTTPTSTDLVNVDEDGHTSFSPEALEEAMDDLPRQDLNDGETESLLLMREEEKLARDAYIVLYNEWGSGCSTTSQRASRRTPMLSSFF